MLKGFSIAQRYYVSLQMDVAQDSINITSCYICSKLLMTLLVN